jgi:hypothetical protein
MPEFSNYETKPKRLRELIEKTLSDAPRSGTPVRFVMV